jgi:hypothetical protein
VIESARAVADAVLYEGFLLYPYSKSALKNQMPFQFGVVMPQGYADASEPSFLRSQFVVCGGSRVDGLLRFLHAADEPVEREIAFTFSLDLPRTEIPFVIEDLRGELCVHVEPAQDVRVVTLTVRNKTCALGAAARNDALCRAFISTHALLEVEGGAFASLLDPPDIAKPAALHCVNERAFPVLAGAEGDGSQTSTILLVSPIILYDFPRIAQASRARTFDGTEIDELLMLSVASLTDREKEEARAAHPYVRELVERADLLDSQTQQTLHGELTGGAPKAGDERVTIAGVTIGPGSHVRVHPKGRADVWDAIVNGMTARVNAVHTDFEGKRYIGVVFDADPAGDMHEWYGRSFFYGADEVEPLP